MGSLHSCLIHLYKFDSMYGVVHHFYYLQLHVDYLPLHQVRLLVLRETSQHSHLFSASTVKVSALRPPKVAPHSPGMSKSSAKTYLRHPCGSMVIGYPQRAHILIRDRVL